jgi:ribosomal RNA-processing protein 12
VILCCKESNTKTREAAYSTLISLAHKLGNETVGNCIENFLGDGISVRQYMEMMIAGLAGTTPHMTSATILALSRVFYEFSSNFHRKFIITIHR